MNRGLRNRLRRQRGQALLLALLVLLMLALLAAALVAVLASSTHQSSRDEFRVRARLLANAGIRYADEMLTVSALGADWRPNLLPYLDPNNGAFDPLSYDLHWDSFEKLQGWDPVNQRAPYANPTDAVYFIKYRFASDEAAASNDPVDPSQDFVPGSPERAVENVEQTVPHDHFLLKVEYAPQLLNPNLPPNLLTNPMDPRSKFIKITAVGRPGGEPTAFAELVAYKAVSIADYLLYVHDQHRTGAVTTLGLNPVDVNGNGNTGDTGRNPTTWARRDPVTTRLETDPAQVSGPNDFLPLLLDGPVRSNRSLEIHAPLAVQPVDTLTFWQEKVEVAGSLSTEADTAAAQGNAQVMVEDGAGALVAYANGSSGATDRNGTLTPSGQPWPDRLDVGINRLEAPRLDSYESVTGVSRWDRLTRYSGTEIPVDEGGVMIAKNSGELGYGQGVYVNNGGQRDLLDSAKNAWLHPETWGGRRYVPRGCIVELFAHYPNPLNLNDPPRILITRTDGSTWVDPGTGKSSGQRSILFQYPDKDGTWAIQNALSNLPEPDNGIIVCDGNVRVLGSLPYSTAGGANAPDYSLTIVSRGSIFVDGPILRPSDYSDTILVDDPRNSRIALLARDHVVINPTTLSPGQVEGLSPATYDVPAETPNDAHFELDPNGTQVLGLRVPVCRDPSGNPNIPNTLTAIDADGNRGDNLPAVASWVCAKTRATLGMQPLITGTATNASPSLLLSPVFLLPNGQPAPATPGQPADLASQALLAGVGCSVPVFMADWSNYSDLLYRPSNAPTQGYLPDGAPLAAAGLNVDPAADELGVPSYLLMQGYVDANGAGSESRSDIIVKNMKVEALENDDGERPRPGLEFVVSALLFAERGTLFVIPGDWFDGQATSPASLASGGSGDLSGDAKYARFHRYNYRVTINGAIAVNELPSLMEASEAADKWCYPQSSTGAALFNDYGAIRYRYDWNLRQQGAGARHNLLPMPALPASPGLIYMGEENQQ